MDVSPEEAKRIMEDSKENKINDVWEVFKVQKKHDSPVFNKDVTAQNSQSEKCKSMEQRSTRLTTHTEEDSFDIAKAIEGLANRLAWEEKMSSDL